MIRSVTYILMALFLVSSSCVSRRSKLNSRNLIPEKDLVPILTEIYLTDGLLSIPRINLKYAPFDSLSTYYYIIEKHGYSKEAMDRTMKYYFIRDTKELVKIYDKVLGILSEMESRNKRLLELSRPRNVTLWPGYDYYFYPDPSGSDSTTFDIPVKRPGKVTVNATVTVFPDDMTYKPAMTGYLCHEDSLETGRRTFTEPVYFIKDGHPHNYSISFTSRSKDTLMIRGNLYDAENMPDDWGKHFEIQNLNVVYSLIGL